jgi:hypothetical protein
MDVEEICRMKERCYFYHFPCITAPENYSRTLRLWADALGVFEVVPYQRESDLMGTCPGSVTAESAVKFSNKLGTW